MKKQRTLLFYALCFLVFIICFKGSAQKKTGKEIPPSTKDTIPERNYSVVLTPQDFKVVDSILVLTLQTVGYEMSTKNTDGLRNGLSKVINYFRFQISYQDSLYNVRYLKPKK